MSVLEVVDPADCDEDGVPLDWERCRRCAGTGKARAREFARIDTEGRASVYVTPPDAAAALAEACEVCAGRGSLKAAVLAGLEEVRLRRAWSDQRFEEREARGETFDPDRMPEDKTAARDQLECHMRDLNRHVAETDASFVVRCEGCGHPMSDGAWEGPRPRYIAEGHDVLLFDAAQEFLRRKREPKVGRVHYSPCDEVCQHGAPIRVAVEGARAALDLQSGEAETPEKAGRKVLVDLMGTTAGEWARGINPDYGPVEAVWRAVDVRTLGWPHDLRPEKLAVLCLRCYAARIGSAA